MGAPEVMEAGNLGQEDLEQRKHEYVLCQVHVAVLEIGFHSYLCVHERAALGDLFNDLQALAPRDCVRDPKADLHTCTHIEVRILMGEPGTAAYQGVFVLYWRSILKRCND